MTKRLFIVPLLAPLLLKAQTQDSTLANNFSSDHPTFFQRDWVKKAVAPTILFGASAATWNDREKIRELRNRYIPTFRRHYDDYLQYVPAATVFGLKFAGVKGRNNLGRATLSYASSAAIMAIIVNSIKYTAKVERPDGSTKNSFPSGHTANAFNNASFLHKEYGLVNPAYSIGAYSAATFTALGRNLNNRHWISDVLAGAGIGILSSELGYFFIDKIYKNKGDYLGYKDRTSDKPSFLSLKVGTALSTTNFLKESELDNKKETGLEAGIEGAYFFTKNWGLGGTFSFTSFPVKGVSFELDDEPETYDIVTQSLGFLNFSVGPYFSHSLSDRLQLMVKGSMGYSSGASGKIFIKSDLIDTPTNELEIADYKPSNGFRWGGGTTLTYKFNNRIGITAYADYHRMNSTVKYTFNDIIADDDMDENLNAQAKEKMNYVGLGLKLTAFF